MEDLGRAANIIQVLDTTHKVFGQIIEIVTKINNFPSHSKAIIRQCNFDCDTLKSIIHIVKANPQLFQSDEENDTIEKVFYDLQIQLVKTKTEIEPYKEDNAFRRLSWAFVGGTKLQEIEREVFQWSQRLYIRFSLLVTRLQGVLARDGTSSLLRIPEILSQHEMRQLVTDAKKVDRGILVKDNEEDEISTLGAPSSQMMGKMKDGQNSRSIVVEWKPYNGAASNEDKTVMETGVALLAAILSYVKPDLMNILQCCGYYHDPANSRFGILYWTPALNSEFVPLDILIEQAPRHPLNKRFEIARRITAAVVFIHGAGWVHKSIRTRRVILFPMPGSNIYAKLGDAYLSGFEDARAVRGNSNLKEQGSWQMRLYRHPDRHGNDYNAYFTPAHDIYSLGVILLEIAMWTPLARLSMNGKLVFENADPQKMKRALLVYADTIERYVGPTYQQLVRQCLEIHENGANGTKLVSEVLGHLEALSVAL